MCVYAYVCVCIYIYSSVNCIRKHCSKHVYLKYRRKSFKDSESITECYMDLLLGEGKAGDRLISSTLEFTQSSASPRKQ